MIRSKLENNITTEASNNYKQRQRNFYVNFLEQTKINYLIILNVKDLTDNKRFWKIVKPFFRPKKVVLFPDIGRVKIFCHLPARLSRMCMRIYFFVSNTHTHKQTKFPLANLFVRIYVFFSSKNRRQGSLFFNKEKCCQSSFLSVNFRVAEKEQSFENVESCRSIKYNHGNETSSLQPISKEDILKNVAKTFLKQSMHLK